MTVSELSAVAARRTGQSAAGREVLAIQDTSEIVLGGPKVRARGFGPVGKGGGLGGVLLHPVLAVDALNGELFGLADIALWNRGPRQELHYSQRGADEKESGRWLSGIRRAGEVLSQAAQVTVVCDREADIYQDFAHKPAGVELLIRAGINRKLATGDKLFDHADALPEACRISVNLAAAPGRASRQALLALRFGPVSLLRPAHGLPAAELKQMPARVAAYLVDIREVDAPEGSAPVHWRLLTSHAVTDAAIAQKMVAFYRKRWIIEDYFKTLKTGGFQVEDTEIGEPKVMLKFLSLAAIAAVTVTQLKQARDNPSGQSLAHAFEPDDQPLIEALCKDYEGPKPTARQTNPHPQGTMAYATWVIARLGGWTGYYGKPGAQTLNRGLQKYYAIKYGAQIQRKFV